MLEITTGSDRQVNDQFRLLVQEVKDFAIFLLTPDGRVATWNDGASRIKLWKAEEIIGQNYRILYREEDRNEGRPEKNIRAAIETGRHEEEWWRVKKDGTLFWAEAVHTAIYNEDGELIGVAKTVRDLTERKKAEDELRRAKEAAEAANVAKSMFIANMSHEIRTPLNAILGFLDLIAWEDDSNLERKANMTAINRNAEVLLRLIDDLLDLSKVENGKLHFEITPIAVRNLFSEIKGQFEGPARDKGLRFEMDISENVPEYMNSDVVRIRQILTNVVGNAVKFTSSGEVRITVTPHVKRPDIPDQISIKVKDTGPGISKDKVEQLFSPFTQADMSVTRKFGGSGLGLALSRKLARELGGDIRIVDCEHNAGCEFEILLSVYLGDAPGEKGAVEQKAPVTALNVHKLRGRKVLVAEDSPDSRLYLQKLLSKIEVDPVFATNGKEALEFALKDEFDIVLMDIQMPELDGNSATQELRNKGFEKPIIALTAHAMIEEKEKALAHGFTEFLTKPISKDRLLETLFKFVN